MLQIENMTPTQMKKREKNLRYRSKIELQNRPFCSVSACDSPEQTKGLCGKHYFRQWKYRRTEMPNTDERFWRRVDVTDSCWLWLGASVGKGYGQFKIGPVNPPTQLVHRYVYVLVNGGIPEGLEIDHLCKVRHCVNPDHLEAVTRLENMLRSDNHIAKQIRTAK